jgi:hypothetical protein
MARLALASARARRKTQRTDSESDGANQTEPAA